jgi:hypothetical protein
MHGKRRQRLPLQIRAQTLEPFPHHFVIVSPDVGMLPSVRLKQTDRSWSTPVTRIPAHRSGHRTFGGLDALAGSTEDAHQVLHSGLPSLYQL